MKLDCRGMLCPQPVIALARAARELPTGSEILITTDDPAAEVDIPAWCRMRKHQCVRSASVDGAVSHIVTVTR